jgi:hypothetical protein
VGRLDAWSEAVIAAGSYPKRIAGVYNVGGGSHVGPGLTIDTAAGLYEHRLKVSVGAKGAARSAQPDRSRAGASFGTGDARESQSGEPTTTP